MDGQIRACSEVLNSEKIFLLNGQENGHVEFTLGVYNVNQNIDTE